MSYDQIRLASQSIKGKPFLCLDFATRVFGVPNEYTYAMEAWDSAHYKHDKSEPLPDVSVPVWFHWTGMVDGVTQDWGHVAVWFPGKGILSSPFSKVYTQQWFDTPQKLVDYLGSGSYIGWSEDINDVRVVQPITQGDTEVTQEEYQDLKNHVMFTEELLKLVLENQGVDDNKIEDLKAHVMNVEGAK